MKSIPVINPANSVPTMENNYVKYEDKIVNSEGMSYDGNGIWYNIDTEIRDKIKISLFVVDSSGLIVNELPVVIQDNDDSTKTVCIQVPSKTTCMYSISGNTALPQTYTLPLGVVKGESQAMNFWRCHKHDGWLSSKVLMYFLAVAPNQGNRAIQTNAESTCLIYGEDVTPSIPTFTLPALFEPISGAPFNVTYPGEDITFIWAAASNMTSGDKYKVQFYQMWGGEIGNLQYEKEVNGDVLTTVINSLLLANQNSPYGVWRVKATNSDGNCITEDNYYVMQPWQ